MDNENGRMERVVRIQDKWMDMKEYVNWKKEEQWHNDRRGTANVEGHGEAHLARFPPAQDKRKSRALGSHWSTCVDPQGSFVSGVIHLPCLNALRSSAHVCLFRAAGSNELPGLC